MDIKKVEPLEVYTRRRNFEKTTEPDPMRVKKMQKKPVFTVQEHHASHLHWDLRLEIDGVMPSWAIPKGPSTDPKIKRLAVQTEDHPIAYATFEGVIPEGEYGAGTVMVWDFGTYENIRIKDGISVPMDQCLKDGRIEIVLHGQKLRGVFVLIKTKINWLFFKKSDEYSSIEDITKTQTRSALTNRTIDEIARSHSDDTKKGQP